MFFWHMILGLECHLKLNHKSQKKAKKSQKNPIKTKKPVATPKLVNWLGFLGEHPPLLQNAVS